MKTIYKLCIIFFLLTTINAKVFAWNYIDTYPYSTENPDDTDPWKFYFRECVSYVAWKLVESGRSDFTNGMKGPNGKTGWFGSASTWADNASEIGFTVNNTPAIGAVAYFPGHVAYVEKVNDNGSVYISEYNVPAYSHNYYERDNIFATSYIHINDKQSCGGSNIVKSNLNISAPYSCKATESIRILPDSTFNTSAGEIRFFIQ